MHADRTKAKNYFLEYASHYNAADPKIKLKIDHTLRVAGLAAKIMQSASSDPADADIGYLMGILHDVGRFEQVRRYHTFIDAQSVNHAALSEEILFQNGEIGNYMDPGPLMPDENGRLAAVPGSDEEAVRKAVLYHNVYQLPANLTEREYLFATVLRDADKIDILRVNRTTPMTEIYDVSEEELRGSAISDEVYADAMAQRNVNRDHNHTPADHLVGHICLIYGLVYPVSRQLTLKQGYLQQMIAFESTNTETAARLSDIGQQAMAFLQG